MLTIAKKLESASDAVGKGLPGNTRALGSAPGSEHCIDSSKAALSSHPKSILYILFFTAGSLEYAQNLHDGITVLDSTVTPTLLECYKLSKKAEIKILTFIQMSVVSS